MTITYIAAVWGGALIGSVISLEIEDLSFSKENLFVCILNRHRVHCFYWKFVCSNIFCIDYNQLCKIFYTVSSKNQIFSAKINLHTLKANVEEGRVAKTLGIVMVSFAFCWLPVCIIAAAHRVLTLPRQVHFTYGFFVCLIDSAINPLHIWCN